jgi:hypothetical protein
MLMIDRKVAKRLIFPLVDSLDLFGFAGIAGVGDG